MPAEATVREKSSVSRSNSASIARLSSTQVSIPTEVSLSISSSTSLAGEQVQSTTNRSVPTSLALAISVIFVQSIIFADVINKVVFRCGQFVQIRTSVLPRRKLEVRSVVFAAGPEAFGFLTKM
jgi:hypothetical protein